MPESCFFGLLLCIAAIRGCFSGSCVSSNVLNNLPKETMMSAKTLLRTEPELSNSSVLMDLQGETVIECKCRCSALKLYGACLYYKICRIKIPIKCVYVSSLNFSVV